jgi:putative endonuclease
MKVMQFCCYVIYSKLLDKYYTGYTSNIDERLLLHNNGHFGGKSYTHKATDWEIFLLIPCSSIAQAISIESKIKRMKSRRYIESLKKYPVIINKLK